MEGISKKSYPYVLECDRDEDPKKQTTFWIKARTLRDTNEIMRLYARSGRDDRKGYRDYSSDRLCVADIDAFLLTVEKVENYKFSEDFKELRKEGWFKEIKDQKTLELVCKDLMSEQRVELFEAASDQAKLTASEKKV